MSDSIVENLKEPSRWLRIAYMIALAIALEVASIVLTLITIAQALFSLFTGKDNVNLRALAKDLGIYVLQIIEFLTYNSELKPFPFSPYPGSEAEAVVEPTAASAKKAASNKAAPEQADAKKAAPKKAAPEQVDSKKAAPKKAAPKKAAPKKTAAKEPTSKAAAVSKPAAKKTAKSTPQDDNIKPEV